MSNTYFAFRQFSVRQERCAMKVSSDACIFGAWVPPVRSSGARILDIGAGTGLLSLMLAQRNPGAQIVALELDAAAAGQAAENIADSIFCQQIEVRHENAMTHSPGLHYDLIVSNPPFFSNSLKGPDAPRNTARHSISLSLEGLFGIVGSMLHPTGMFALLMPLDAERAIIENATRCGLHCHRSLVIRDNDRSMAKRGCWLFGYDPVPGTADAKLIIRQEGGYSADYIALLRDYYTVLP